MRWVLLALIAVAAVLYFSIGLRLGFVTLVPTQLLNAQGQSRYGFEAYEPDQSVGVVGTCRVRQGRATLRLFDPSGEQIAARTCPKGVWALQLTGYGQQGFYRVVIDYNRFSGVMDLKESRTVVQR